MNIERIMRIFHRWISLPVAIFMGGIAVTGIILHFQLIENPPGQGGGGPGETIATACPPVKPARHAARFGQSVRACGCPAAALPRCRAAALPRCRR